MGTDEEDVVREFQHSRQAFFKSARIWLVMLISGFVLFVIGLRSETMVWKVVGFVMSGLPIAVLVLRVKSSYVCPRCRQVPLMNMHSGKGVDLNPEECPNCGVRLR